LTFRDLFTKIYNKQSITFSERYSKSGPLTKIHEQRIQLQPSAVN